MAKKPQPTQSKNKREEPGRSSVSDSNKANEIPSAQTEISRSTQESMLGKSCETPVYIKECKEEKRWTYAERVQILTALISLGAIAISFYSTTLTSKAVKKQTESLEETQRQFELSNRPFLQLAIPKIYALDSIQSVQLKISFFAIVGFLGVRRCWSYDQQQNGQQQKSSVFSTSPHVEFLFCQW